jgi:hypothetical protein
MVKASVQSQIGVVQRLLPTPVSRRHGPHRASDIDAAQDARTAGQAADHVRQRPAWTSDGVRPRRRQGIGRAGELIDMAGNDAALPEIAKSVVKIFAGQLAAIQASIAS